MVLAGDHNVSHARVLGHLDPLVRVKFFRIKLSYEFVILVNRDFCTGADPLPMIGLAAPLSRGNRVQAPVDEQTKSGLSPPRHSRFTIEIIRVILTGKDLTVQYKE